jgi:Fe2+ transport system protein B
MTPPRNTTDFSTLRESIIRLEDVTSAQLSGVKASTKELWESVHASERSIEMLLTELHNIHQRLDRHHEQDSEMVRRIEIVNDGGCTRSKMNQQDIQALKEMNARFVSLQEMQMEKLDKLAPSVWQQHGAGIFINAIVVALVVALMRVYFD